MDELAYSLVRASAVRECAVRGVRTVWCSAYAAFGCVLNVRCCADACYVAGRSVR